MRRLLFATSALLLSTAPLAAAPVPKEQLMTAPAGARHFTISSAAGKHGDNWAWTLPDGTTAYRMSMSLRGWITETDQTVVTGKDGRPVKIVIRGFTDSGDAGETFSVDDKGVATWKTSVDEGSAPIGAKRYSTYGGPWLAGEQDIAALVAAGEQGIELLPSGRATLKLAETVQITGPAGPKTVRLGFVTGTGFAPSPVWLDADNKFFGFAGSMGLLPAGYEGVRDQLKSVSEAATAKIARDG